MDHDWIPNTYSSSSIYLIKLLHWINKLSYLLMLMYWIIVFISIALIFCVFSVFLLCSQSTVLRYSDFAPVLSVIVSVLVVFTILAVILHWDFCLLSSYLLITTSSHYFDRCEARVSMSCPWSYLLTGTIHHCYFHIFSDFKRLLNLTIYIIFSILCILFNNSA